MEFEFLGRSFSDDRDNLNAICVNDLLLFFKFKSDEDFSSLEGYADLADLRSRVQNIIFSFLDFPINLDNYNERSLVPQFLWQNLERSRVSVYVEALQQSADLVGEENFLKICEFFSNFKSDILNKLNFSIKTTNDKANIELVFAENFRFKSTHDSFNLFSLPKNYRDCIIPQDDNSLIFVADFRQFEFRSFLDIQTNLGIQNLNRFLKFENIYEEIGKELKIASNPKESIISYLYNSSNFSMESFFKKQDMIEKIQDGICWCGDLPVFVKDDYDFGKKIHTIIQTVSQFRYIEKLHSVLFLLNGKKSKFLFPLHDSVIVSINRDEPYLIDQIIDLMEDDVYKTKCYIGNNFRDIEEV